MCRFTRDFLVVASVALGCCLLMVGCSERPSDRYVDQQLQYARQQGVTVSPDQEQQLRQAAHAGEDAEREMIRRDQQEAIANGRYVPDAIR